MPTKKLSDRDFQQLLDLRSQLRRFLRWSERQAGAVGLTPAQHQLLLAIRGHPDARGPTIGEAAEYLALRHNSAVGLVDRAVAAGLVKRVPDVQRPGTVRLGLTRVGTGRLDELAALHLEELVSLAPSMEELWRRLKPLPGSPLAFGPSGSTAR
jgi:DNA-binding MarR family transcriptional regulator